MSTDQERLPSLAPKFPLKVLVVEDNPADAELCIEFLSVAQFEVTADIAQTPKEFLTSLQTASYDIILADYNLGRWTGMDAFDLLQKEGCDIPFILLTAGLGDQTAVECMKRGLADYVLKDRMERLPVAIYRALEEKGARNERRRIERAVEEAEGQFRALAECARAAVFVEQDGRCTYVNHAAEAITGFPQKQLLQMGLWELIPEPSRASVYVRQIHGPRHGELPIRCQAPIVTKFGAERWLDCTVKLIHKQGRFAILMTAVPIPRPAERAARSQEAACAEPAETFSLRRPRRELALAATAT